MTSKLTYVKNILTDAPKADVVSINLTPYCNQRCKYCEIGNGRVTPTKPLLTLDDLKWIIDQMVTHDIPLISIGGGEPLTVPWLWDVIPYAAWSGVDVEIITNGMTIPKLTEDQIERLKLTSNVSVSIDIYDSEIQDTIRGVPGAFGKQRDGLDILHQNKIPFSIATVLSKYNYNRITELTRMMDSHGARFVKFQPVWVGSNFPDVDGINKNELVIEQGQIPVLVEELKSIVEFEKVADTKTNAGELLDWISVFLSSERAEPVFKQFVNKYRCHTLHSIITINYYGDVLPCNYLKPVDNIKSHSQDMVAVWDRTCKDARETFKKGWYYPECVGCTCSMEMSTIGSAIRYPITNICVMPKIAGMVIHKLEKQRALK